MVHVDGVFGARVHEVEESSHESLVHVVEAERVARAALSAYLEVDGVADVPILFGVLGDAIPV